MRHFLRLAGVGVSAAALLYGQIHLPGMSPGNGTKTTPPAAPAASSAAPHQIDYYVLSLSVKPGRITVTGFRGQPNEGPAPEACENVKPAPKSALRIVETLMPDPAEIQREWARHGSCTGFTAAEYLNTLRYTRSLVQIPVQLTSLEDDAAEPETPRLIESQYASANPGFPAGAFRVTGAATEVCFSLELKPQACPAPAAPR